MMIFICIISALLEPFKTDIFSIWLETVHTYKYSQCHASFYFLNKTYTLIFFPIYTSFAKKYVCKFWIWHNQIDWNINTHFM